MDGVYGPLNTSKREGDLNSREGDRWTLGGKRARGRSGGGWVGGGELGEDRRTSNGETARESYEGDLE